MRAEFVYKQIIYNLKNKEEEKEYCLRRQGGLPFFKDKVSGSGFLLRMQKEC